MHRDNARATQRDNPLAPQSTVALGMFVDDSAAHHGRRETFRGEDSERVDP